MYRALVSFAGVINMHQGEIREITNSDLAKSLLKAKLIEKYKETKAAELKKENKMFEKENKQLQEEIEALKNELQELKKPLENEDSDEPTDEKIDNSSNEDSDEQDVKE